MWALSENWREGPPSSCLRLISKSNFKPRLTLQLALLALPFFTFPFFKKKKITLYILLFYGENT